MIKDEQFESFYRQLFIFLMLAKQQVITQSTEHGLTMMQGVTLLLLDADTPNTMGRFCTIFGCDASNVTGIIDGLVQKRLVTRQEHPKDRRVKIITLLPQGIEVRRQILADLANKENFLFADLSAQDFADLTRIVEKSLCGRPGFDATCPVLRKADYHSGK